MVQKFIDILMLKLFRVAESCGGWMRNRPMDGSTNCSLFIRLSVQQPNVNRSILKFWYVFDGGIREKPWLNSCRFISSFVLTHSGSIVKKHETRWTILVFDSNRLCHMHREHETMENSRSHCAHERVTISSVRFLCSNLSCASGGRMLVLLPTRNSVIVK